MKIDRIFAIVGNSLITVQYSEYKTHELERLFDNWTDVEYLFNFFQRHVSDLQSGFYGNISIIDAIDKTIADAENLEQRLIELAESGQNDFYNNLQTLFKPLDNKDYRIREHQKSKAYGLQCKSWLRIYAIRIAKNTYVISGGAIKLTSTMNEREHLKLELHKLEITKQYLIDNSLYDENDFEYLILS